MLNYIKCKVNLIIHVLQGTNGWLFMLYVDWVLEMTWTMHSINSLHVEIVCMSVIINAEINVICLRVKVSSIA